MRYDILFNFPFRLGLPGIGNTAWQQAAGLARLGHRVVVVTPSCEKPVPGARVIQTLRPLGVRLPLGKLGVERMLRLHGARAARVFERLVRRGSAPDVVHCWPRGSLALIHAARRADIPVFYERPNTHVGHGRDVVARELRRMGLPAVDLGPAADERVARESDEYAAADFLLCPSDAVADSHRARGARSRTVLRTQYGCDTDVFTPATTPREPGGLRVLFCGRADARKGLHFALEAWRRSADQGRVGGSFRCVGAFDETYRRRVARGLTLEGVETRDFTSDVAGEMRRADVLVLPSIEEGSALVTYEARAAGCVVLASRAAGAPVVDGETGLLHEVADVDRLTKQITALATDGALLADLRRRSLASSRELSWTAAAESVALAYAIGLSRAGRPPQASQPLPEATRLRNALASAAAA